MENVGFKTIPIWKWILLYFCHSYIGFDVEENVACVCFAKVLFHHIYVMREDYYCMATGNLIRTRKLTRKGD